MQSLTQLSDFAERAPRAAPVSLRPRQIRVQPSLVRYCRVCGGVGYLITTRKIGGRDYSGAVTCRCLRRRKLIAQARLVPEHFRRMNLARLKPDNDRHFLQAATLAALREDPGGSFALFGRNRVGKSLFTWCLVRHALISDKRVCAVNLSDLLDDYRKLELGRAGDVEFRPRVTASDVEANSDRWCIALQEFDKARPTEFAAETLFRLVDAIVNSRAQLIITSNLDANQLSEHWGRAATYFGTSIVSRVLEHCTEVNLF